MNIGDYKVLDNWNLMYIKIKQKMINDHLIWNTVCILCVLAI